MYRPREEESSHLDWHRPRNSNAGERWQERRTGNIDFIISNHSRLSAASCWRRQSSNQLRMQNQSFDSVEWMISRLRSEIIFNDSYITYLLQFYYTQHTKFSMAMDGKWKNVDDHWSGEYKEWLLFQRSSHHPPTSLFPYPTNRFNTPSQSISPISFALFIVEISG